MNEPGNNTFDGNNPVVRNAIMANIRKEIQDAVGFLPSDDIVSMYASMSKELRPSFLSAIKAAHESILGYGKDSGSKTIATKQQSDALRELKDTLYRDSEQAKAIKSQIEGCARSLGQIAAGINNSNNELSLLKDGINSEAKTLKELDNVVAGMKRDVAEKLKSVDIEVAKITKKSIEGAKQQVNDFVNNSSETVDKLKEDLRKTLSLATVGVLSSCFESKRASLNLWYIVSFAGFVVCLGLFAVIGLYALHASQAFVTPELAERYGDVARYLVVHKVLLRLAPLYFPLLWLTCHMNKLVNHNRRLMEEYAHKVVVTQTYTGVAEQVEALENKGIPQSGRLSENLLSNTIRVICTNPNECLDKVKSATPISEVVDNVSKLMRATAELKKSSENGDESRGD